MTTRIKLRRDTYQNWYDHNPTLALGEPGYDTTNNQVKVGDGTTAWRALDPLTAALGDLVVAGSTITSPEGVHQNLVLSTVDTGPTTHDWTFGLDGATTFPSGAGFVLGDEGQLKVNDGTTLSLDLRDTSGRGFYTDSNGFVVRGNSGKTWEFNQDGKLRLPGSSNSAFIQDVEDRTVIANYGTDYWTTLGINSAEGKFDFAIKNITNNSDTIHWEFNNDGGTTLPGKLHGAVDLSPVDNLPVGHTLSIAPAWDHSSKSFNFRIDQYSGPYSFTRAYLDMPVAEFRKQVAITFAHDNETGGYIHMQGSNATGDGLDNAFNIQSTGADIKLSATGQIWKFGTDGTTLFPDAAIDGGTAPIELKSRSWSQLTYNNADMTPEPNKNHSTTFYVEGGDALLEIFRWDGDSVLQHRQWTFSNDGSLTLPTGGEIKTEAGTGDVVIEANDGTARTWTFGGDGILDIPGNIYKDGANILVDVPDNQWVVDPSRTDTYVADGTLHKPFKTITAALDHIETLIAGGDLPEFDETANIVLSPQFILLTSSTTENVTLTRGHIYIVGSTPDAGHVPIWIKGHVTITPSASTGNAKAANDFGLFHVAVLPSGNYHGITVNGSNPCRVYLEDVYVYQGTTGYSCVYMDNDGTDSKLELIGCTVGRDSGTTHLIDIQHGYCAINNLETNGVGQVLNQANASTGTMLNSTVGANTGAVITLSGSVQWGMGSCILNNTSSAANTYGIDITSSSVIVQFGVCTFNIPAAQASNRAIKGVAGALVLYASPIFQYGTCNLISTEITLAPLTTTFQAV